MVKVFLSPSNQVANKYAYGNTNESVQCKKIADACKNYLIKNGIDAQIGHNISLENKCIVSNQWGADLHVCIHTNASNGKVTGTRIFSYDKDGQSYKACKAVFDVLAPITPGNSESVTPYPTLYEIKNTKAPAVYIEVEFHDNADAAKWIIENTTQIGEAIAIGIMRYFGIKVETPTTNTLYKVQVGAFGSKTNAETFLKTVKAAGFKDAYITTK